MNKLLKSKIYIPIFLLLALVTVGVLSDQYFMASFIKIEDEIDRKAIFDIVENINSDLENLRKINLDYAQWDHTYEFIRTRSPKYLYENFRGSTDTLESLNIDFMIFADLKRNVVFSIYSKNSSLKDKKVFEKGILGKLASKANSVTVYKTSASLKDNKQCYFLVAKSSISNSEGSAETNGYLYSGEIISPERIHKVNSLFNKVSFSEVDLKEYMYIIDSKYLSNIHVMKSIDNSSNSVVHNIQFYDNTNKFVFSLVTYTKRKLIAMGKEAINTYNIIISCFLAFVFFLVYRGHNILKLYNYELQRDVDARTSEIIEANKKLKAISETDELTKIHNRRNFFKLGARALEDSILSGTDLSVILLDVDDFKRINDTYGHAVGDLALVKISKAINLELEEKYIFGRLGGEEFALVLPDTNIEDAFLYAEKLRHKVSLTAISINENESVFCTISMGVVEKFDLCSLDLILHEADKLMFKSKNAGKNRSSTRS